MSSSRSGLNRALASAWSSPSSSRSAYDSSTESSACAFRSGISSPLNVTRSARKRFSSSSSRSASCAGDESGLAGLAQAVEELAVVARRVAFRLPERVELLAAEEIGVAADDLRLLRGLLLADANGAPLLRAFEEVPLEALLEVRCAENRSRSHSGTLARRRATSTRVAGSNGFVRIASARPWNGPMSAEPVTSATGVPSPRSRSSRSFVVSLADVNVEEDDVEPARRRSQPPRCHASAPRSRRSRRARDSLASSFAAPCHRRPRAPWAGTLPSARDGNEGHQVGVVNYHRAVGPNTGTS